MRKYQFILKLREEGFTDLYIADVLELRQREREQGIMHSWEDYLTGDDRKQSNKKIPGHSK